MTRTGGLAWDIDVGQGRTARVELGRPSFWTGFARSFHVDGTRHSLGGYFGRYPRVTAFDLQGHHATLSLALVRPTLAIRLRRAFRGVFRGSTVPSSPLGAGFASGVASSDAVSTLLTWGIYELTVNGASRGSWIAKALDGSWEWWYSPPGSWVPDDHAEGWPGSGRADPADLRTLEQHLYRAEPLPGWDGHRAWTPALAETVRAVHDALGRELVPTAEKTLVSYRRPGDASPVVVQLSSYEGRLYLPRSVLGEARPGKAPIQAAAQAAGLRVGGTWVELPEDPRLRGAVLEIVDRLLRSEAAANP